MKNKILLGVVVILGVILVVVSNKNTNHFSNENINILVKDNEEVKNLNLDDYLLGVLAAEMPASFEMEALKAGAVASRTYALYKMKNKNQDYDILASTINQAYVDIDSMKAKWLDDFDKYKNKLKQAISDTKDEVMFYNDEIIEAYYFSMSNGKTEESENVFKENLPYIKSVDSAWDNETINNFIYQKEISKEEFCHSLEISDCQNIIITDIKKDSSGRIASLLINNKLYEGTSIRTKLDLRSTDFEIAIKDKIIITTRGYGHGVGLSQYGANGMAKEGKNYQEILNYYYNDILIKKFV